MATKKEPRATKKMLTLTIDEKIIKLYDEWRDSVILKPSFSSIVEAALIDFYHNRINKNAVPGVFEKKQITQK